VNLSIADHGDRLDLEEATRVRQRLDAQQRVDRLVISESATRAASITGRCPSRKPTTKMPSLAT
jgi:hypothetical protein